MKNFKILAVCLFLGISVSYAQQKQGTGMRNSNPTERAKSMVERLNKELSLTKTQQDSIYNFMVQKANHKNEQSAKGTQSSREDHTAKIKSFLTKEQIAKYDALEKQPNRRKMQPTTATPKK